VVRNWSIRRDEVRFGLALEVGREDPVRDKHGHIVPRSRAEVYQNIRTPGRTWLARAMEW
jgi:hypothetical protein